MGATRIHFGQTEYGFDWGSAVVRRLFSNGPRGWVTIGVNGLQIYVTRTGKIRIHDDNGEWKKPKSKKRK